MPESQPSLFSSLPVLVLLRYLLPALLFLFVLHALRLMAADLSRFGGREAMENDSTAPAELVVAQGTSPAAGERFRLLSNSVLLGRDPTADICLADRFASAQHARIARHGGRYFLADLGTTNGTSLNGQRVTESTFLADGDEIEIGETILRFERRGERA